MTDKTMTVKATRSFQGAEGMWTRGVEKTAPADISLERAKSLVRKGLAEEVTAGDRETKPAPAPVTRPGNRPQGGQAAPTTKPAPPLQTKAAKPLKPGKAPKAGKGDKAPAADPAEDAAPAERVEVSVLVEGVTITIPRQLFGDGDKAFEVAETVIKGEPETDYSVFAFPDGSTPVAVTGEKEIETVAAKAGAELLDVVTTGKA